MFFVITDTRLDELCVEGSGAQISNPFYESFAQTNGIILTLEQVEELEEQEYEEDDVIIEADLNVDQDYWEA
jgi:hypothetical protein